MAELGRIDLIKHDKENDAGKNSEAKPKHLPVSESDRKKAKLIAIVAAAVIVLFVASFISFKLLNKPEVIQTDNGIITIYNKNYYTYNGFEFRYSDKLWVTQIYEPGKKNLYTVPLHFGPKDLLDVQVDKQMISFLDEMRLFRGPDNRSAVFVTYDPEVNSSFVTLSYYELSQNLRDTLQIKTLPTLTKESDAVENETVKICNGKEPVIYLRYLNPAYVYYTKNCLVIQGEESEMIKAVDRALLQFYGIMT